jgi:Reverse transcriptase (RNA-dependent DNA polymerase)/Type II intron maturase
MVYRKRHLQLFSSLDHTIMVKALSEKVHDNRFLRLIQNMLEAGYLEDWTWGATLSGVPQGGVVSPVLSNIYLDKLDKFVETVLVPDYTRGQRRATNPAYREVAEALRRARRRGDRVQARQLRQWMRNMPSKDLRDPGYRRLYYTRYADDHLLGFTGPKDEAVGIKDRLETFLREDLKLELSAEKTLITHARTGAARYLGYEITVQHGDSKITAGRRAANGKIALRVPADVIKAKCAPYLRHGKPWHRGLLQNLDDYDIVRIYGAEYRGIVQYYLPANNVSRLNRLEWVTMTSMLKTLAAKHKSSVSKMAARHKAKITTPHGLRTCFEARIQRDAGKQPLVARFGGIPLKRQKRAVLVDLAPVQITYPRKELVHRLRKGKCELCQRADTVQVHQIRKLAELATLGPASPKWMKLMAGKRRKTLVVCPPCHHLIHDGQRTAAFTA